MTDLWTLSAADLARRYREGETSPVAVLDATLARLDAVNDGLNAVVTQDRDGAALLARASAARWRAGTPL